MFKLVYNGKLLFRCEIWPLDVLLLLFQPIRSQFSFFGDYSPGCDEPRAKDTKEWLSTLADLQFIIKRAALFAHHAKKLSDEQLCEYNISGTIFSIVTLVIKLKTNENFEGHIRFQIYFYAPLEKGGILFLQLSVGMSVCRSAHQVLSTQYLLTPSLD